MGKYTVLSGSGLLVAFFCHARGAAAQYDRCTNGTVATISDGRCDAENNNPFCGFDGGDCCPCTCSDGPTHSCNASNVDCEYPSCGDPSPVISASGCTEDCHGDGMCDASENTAECGYDGGDCCPHTCSDGPVYNCGSYGFNCVDPEQYNPTLVAEFPECAEGWGSIGDGLCDGALNGPLCGYDGGDCCFCTCVGSYCSKENQFDCVDSAAGEELFDCAASPPAALPCSGEAQQKWVVEESAQVPLLAAAINCSGGSFEVEWNGNVVVNQTVYIGDGTVLTVTGAESGAVIDGDSLHRIFTVVNASLHLSNLNISSGASIAGGGVAAAGSRLVFNETNFLGNRASSHGGAVYASDGSSVTCVGSVTFADNEADIDGGAMFVTGQSIVSCGGTWFNNRAGRDGGALMAGSSSNVSWSEEATFTNNTAGSSGGGVVVFDGATLSWNATANFSSNSADVSGGAVVVHFGSSASWSGNTTFTNNFAKSGGALAIIDSTCAQWSLVTKFVGNEATDGGAVYVFASMLWWTGDGTAFHENRATSNGGGMNLVSSHVYCTDNKFFGNSAGGTGGALHMHEHSSLEFDGNTVFRENRAVRDPSRNESGYGGCLSADWSELSWRGDMRFVNNSAETIGGVIYASESEVSWSNGTTKFESNTAALSGGAIFVWNESTVTWTGDTEFTSNRAFGDGGAVASPALDSVYNLLGSTMVIRGSTVFSNNTCEANGGAFAMIEGLSLEFGTAVDVSFVGNKAAVAGGAVFVSGIGVGPKFTGVSFISNFAQVGGAVSSLGSGKMKGFADIEAVNPTTFERCHFFDNQATATGGAIDSAAGEDKLAGCIFIGNGALAGGALRLAGVTSLENCSFVDNLSADGGGSAVSNIGSISRMTDVSFSGNGFKCDAGTYLQFDKGHPYDKVCSGCATECHGCLFSEPTLAPACTVVMDHSSSVAGTATLAALSIESGFWRATAASTTILACHNTDACLGGVTGSADYCRRGYEGAYCSVCTDEYTQEQGFACRKCSDSNNGIVVIVVLAVVAVGVGVAVVSHVMWGQDAGRTRGPAGRLLRNIPLQSVKIVISAWQILTQFTAMANVTYPDTYQRFLDGLDVFNFDLGWVLSAGCMLNLNFHRRLMISTVGPIIALLFLAGTYVVAATANRGSPDALKIIWNKFVSMVLLLTFFVYSSVSATLFGTFACEELDDGIYYLRVDYSIECDSPEHRGYQVYAGFMIVLYTVGIPFLYGALLFRDREVLRKDAAHREDDPRVTAISDLWKPYKPSVFYYEVVECCRRLLLAGVVVFISPGTAAQIAITLLMAFVFVVLSEGLAPHASVWDTWLSRTGHAVVFMSMYFALLLKVDVSKERAGSQKVFEGVLVGAHACMIVVIVIETVVLTCSMKTDPLPVPSLQPLRRLYRKKDAGDEENKVASGDLPGAESVHLH